MIEIVLLLLGSILGFAHAARNWLAIRMKEGRRCVPKVFLWRGVRNTVAALGALAVLMYLGQNASTTATTGTPSAVWGSIFGALFLFAVGVGIGNGLSNLFGGTLSFVTEGPNQPSESSDQPSKSKPKTDDYGQLKK